MLESEQIQTTSNLSRKQETLIAAMMTLPTIEAASKAAGITSKTARIWMKQPQFQEAYNAARQVVFDEALDELRDGVHEAIAALKRNLKAMDPAVQVRAAHIWLQHAIQLHKIEQLEARLQELEEALKARHV